jgi:hypothetical protein
MEIVWAIHAKCNSISKCVSRKEERIQFNTQRPTEVQVKDPTDISVVISPISLSWELYDLHVTRQSWRGKSQSSGRERLAPPLGKRNA